MTDELQQRQAAQRDRVAAETAGRVAGDAARQQVAKRIENPEFFQQLRDPDVDSGEFPWLEDELGPLFSGAHIIGHRDDDYEQHIKWGNMARAERVIHEGSPGRLCRGSVQEIAQGTHTREDKAAKGPHTVDERRAVRDAHEASTNLKSLAVGAKGLNSVTQATAVSKVEKNEQENKSLSERTAGFLD